MQELIYLILLFGSVNCIVLRLKTKQYVTASNLFYLAWLIILPLSEYASASGYIPRIDGYSLQLLFKAHVGAFFGFLFANFYILSKGLRSPQQFVRNSVEIVKMEIFIARHYTKILILLGSLGLLHLVERLNSVGFDSSSLLGDIRNDYLENRLSFLGRISAYFFTAVTPLSVILGFLDARRGNINLNRIVWLVLVSATHGLAMGGRGFLAGVILPYLLSFYLAVKVFGQKVRGFQLLRKVGAYFVAASLLFTYLGEVRSSSSGPTSMKMVSADANIFERARVMMVSWVGVAVPAIGPTSRFASQVEPLNGYLIYGFFSDQLEKFGMPIVEIPKNKPDFIRNPDAIDAIRNKIGRLGYTPPTIIPKLIEDAGESFMPYYLGLLMFICHVWSVRLAGMGLFRHSLACIAIQAAYMTVQTYFFLFSATYIGLIWTLIIIYLALKSVKLREIPVQVNS
jgi:hypothetical protein